MEVIALNRRISLWLLVGLMVACFWAVMSFVLGPSYNLGASTLVGITAPVALFSGRFPLGIRSAILLNGILYALVGVIIEVARWLYHKSLNGSNRTA
jgi:hypothetical protein